MERSLFESFEEGGILAESHLQSFMVFKDADAFHSRIALLTAGHAHEVLVYSNPRSSAACLYPDAGSLEAVIDAAELSELSHLAELCGRNKLAVYKPSQLTSAIIPTITFDRNAHLAVYTGEQPCADPGRSSLQFRPQHGEQAIDSAVIEQLIAPIIRAYEADGTAVFDCFGGAAVRRLQAPDEILMFAVDTSASMRLVTDFEEVNEDFMALLDDTPNVSGLVEGEFYNRATFDEMKEHLCVYEGFDDMIGIVSQSYGDRKVASHVLQLLRLMLSSEIISKAKQLGTRRERARNYRRGLEEIESALEKLKTFWAGIQTRKQTN